MICFPQDISGFAKRTGVVESLRIGDRVNTIVPPGGSCDSFTAWKTLSAAEKHARAQDDDGRVVYPATILDSNPASGEFMLKYDGVPDSEDPGSWWVRSLKVEPRISIATPSEQTLTQSHSDAASQCGKVGGPGRYADSLGSCEKNTWRAYQDGPLARCGGWS